MCGSGAHTVHPLHLCTQHSVHSQSAALRVCGAGAPPRQDALPPQGRTLGRRRVRDHSVLAPSTEQRHLRPEHGGLTHAERDAVPEAAAVARSVRAPLRQRGEGEGEAARVTSGTSVCTAPGRSRGKGRQQQSSRYYAQPGD